MSKLSPRLARVLEIAKVTRKVTMAQAHHAVGLDLHGHLHMAKGNKAKIKKAITKFTPVFQHLGLSTEPKDMIAHATIHAGKKDPKAKGSWEKEPFHPKVHDYAKQLSGLLTRTVIKHTKDDSEYEKTHDALKKDADHVDGLMGTIGLDRDLKHHDVKHLYKMVMGHNPYHDTKSKLLNSISRRARDRVHSHLKLNHRTAPML